MGAKCIWFHLASFPGHTECLLYMTWNEARCHHHMCVVTNKIFFLSILAMHPAVQPNNFCVPERLQSGKCLAVVAVILKCSNYVVITLFCHKTASYWWSYWPLFIQPRKCRWSMTLITVVNRAISVTTSTMCRALWSQPDETS